MTAGTYAVVDSGPLIAALDPADPHHRRVVEVLESPGLHFVVPALVVAEVIYFLALRLGSDAEAAFLADLASADVRLPSAEEWRRCAELVRRYRDFPLGGTDASVVALTERLSTDLIVTLDLSALRRDPAAACFRVSPIARMSSGRGPSDSGRGGR